MDKLFDSMPENKHIKSFMKQRAVMDQLTAHWDDIFGKLSKDLQLVMVRDGVLYIDSQNPVWATEIEYYKADILKKIKSYVKARSGIKQIKLSLNQTKPSFYLEQTGTKVDLSQLSFSDKIRVLNEKRKKEGQKLCSRCDQVYTFDEVCHFCLAEQKTQKDSPL